MYKIDCLLIELRFNTEVQCGIEVTDFIFWVGRTLYNGLDQRCSRGMPCVRCEHFGPDASMLNMKVTATDESGLVNVLSTERKLPTANQILT